MSISHVFIFKKVHNTTSVRPVKPQKPYVDAVVKALYEEKLSVFTANGLHLDESRFKTSPEVTKLAANFYKRVNEFWKVQTNPDRIIDSHPTFFTKDFDFSLVDLDAMVTDGPQAQQIDVPYPVDEDPIEEALATLGTMEPQPVNVPDPIDENPIQGAVATLNVKSPGKRFTDLCPNQQLNRAKKVRRSMEFEELMASAETELRARGNHFAAYCLQQIKDDLDLAEKTKKHIKAIKNDEIKKAFPTADPLDCLALMFKEDLSVQNYTVSSTYFA